MPPTPKRLALRYGPYRTPRYKIGQVVMDEVRGEVTIVGTSTGRIPWPIGKRGRTYSFVVYGELVRALSLETNQAVCHHWGMTGQTVSKWCRILGFKGETPSALAIKSERFKGAVGRRARRAGKPTLSSPERAAKISAAKTGVFRSEATIAKLRAANVGKKVSATVRAKMSASHKRRYALGLGPQDMWSKEDEELLRRLPAKEVAQRTGRSLRAVYNHRSRLGINTGRTDRHRQ